MNAGRKALDQRWSAPLLICIALLTAIGLAACSGGGEEAADDGAESSVESSVVQASATEPLGDSPSSTAAASAIPPDVAERMATPSGYVPLVKTVGERTAAIEVFHQAGDRSIIPGVLEIINFINSRRAIPLTRAEVSMLRDLTGQFIPVNDWESWIEWWWANPEREDHVGYRPLKSFLFTRISPAYSRLLDPDGALLVDPTEIILRPGRPVGAFPSMSDPFTITRDSDDIDFMNRSDLIAGLEIDGERRCYPLRMLRYHDVVNDTLGGKRIVLAFNSMTGTAFAHEVVSDSEEPVAFEGAGLLYRADMLMYDRGTSSLWSTRTGKPISGPMAEGDPPVRLEPLAVTQASWRTWSLRWPDTTVLSPNTGYKQVYLRTEMPVAYDDSPEVGIPLRHHDPRLDPKERVLGIAIGGDAIAYPYSELGRYEFVYDNVGGERIFIRCPGFRRRDEFRVYRAGDRTFRLGSSSLHLSEIETGDVWRITESALEFGPEHNVGLRVERIPAEVTLWYAWKQAHPDTRIYQSRDTRERLAQEADQAAPLSR